jgi:hypothetical protein|tara:strand:- start:541 stop:945 length:405 start_codon:yes stop_codon:yes gene_type:complete
MGNSHNSNIKTFRKGDLVRLNVNTCFTIEQGGNRTRPLSHHANDQEGTVDGFYILTHDERREISHKYTGTDSAGEPKIVPREGYTSLKRGQVYPVLRSRIRAIKNFRKISGLALVLDTQSGKHVYVSRGLLEKV